MFFFVLQSLVLVSGLGTCVFCGLYIRVQLKINEHVRTILMLEIMCSFVLNILAILGFVLVDVLKVVNFLTCSLFGKNITIYI